MVTMVYMTMLLVLVEPLEALGIRLLFNLSFRVWL